MLAITNAKIFTMEDTTGIIEKGTVLIEEDHILEVGEKVTIPEGVRRIDARGANLLPGFIEAHCHMGITEEKKGREGDDSNESVNPLTPYLRAIDAINPMDAAFHSAVAAGITSAMIGPGSSNVVGGQFAFVKTHGRCMDEMIRRTPAAMKVAFGENPKTNYGMNNRSPYTRMAIASMLRQELSRAKWYIEKEQKGTADGPGVRDKFLEGDPEKEFRYGSYRPVFSGEIPLKAHVHRADDILTALRIAKEFGVSLTLDHCSEGHLVAGQIKESGFPVVVGPHLSSRNKIEVRNMAFKTAGILEKAGIPVAITTDHPVTLIQSLPLCAALAVKEGMSMEGGLKAITISAARICRMDHKVGNCLSKCRNVSLTLYLQKHVEYNTNVCGGIFLKTQKRNRLRRTGLLFCLCSLFLITGCQSVQQVTGIQNSQENDRDTDIEESVTGEGFVGEEKYEQVFVKPETNSNIFIDLKGYAPGDKKQAYFLGENLSRDFFVYDNRDKKLVYTGELKDTGKKNKDGKSVYKGDFSEVTDSGVYYIQTAVIGQSYAFPIDENRYKNQLEELEKEFLEQSPTGYYTNRGQDAEKASLQEDSVNILYSFQKLAVAYTFFGEVYGEDYEKKLEEHARWLLTEREAVLTKRAEAESPDYNNPGSREQLIAEEDYMFASAMGAGYTALQPYNPQLASQCLSQAQKAYQNASRFRFLQAAEMDAAEIAAGKEIGDMQYMAAASLNRATGSYTYRSFIKDRYAVEDTFVSDGSIQEDDFTGNKQFWGNLFYMTTPKNVDMEICSRQMKELMNACSEYTTYYSKSVFGVASPEEDPLECGIWLTMADYTIVSREYRDVCKAQMHFLLSDVETVDPGHEQKSAMLLILGNIERETAK